MWQIQVGMSTTIITDRRFIFSSQLPNRKTYPVSKTKMYKLQERALRARFHVWIPNPPESSLVQGGTLFSSNVAPQPA